MVEQLVELGATLQSLKNDYLRALADFDNFRKRMEREMERNQWLKAEALMVELLPVLDNFERALNIEQIKNSSPCASSTSEVNGLKRGVEIIYRQLCAILERHGLKAYSCLGEEFDPRRAEAVKVDSEQQAIEGRLMVVEEFCRGYECGGRVVRPARVKVAKVSGEANGISRNKQESID